MTTYRTKLPLPDAQFYGWQYDRSGNVPGWQPGVRRATVYTPIEECLDKLRESGSADLEADGIVYEVEADDEYELAVTMKDLESELNANQYWESPLIIERPRQVL